MTALVCRLQESGFEFLEDLGGLNEHIISELDVLPEDFVFLKRVAAGVLAEASASRCSKKVGNVEVPLLPVLVLRQVHSGQSFEPLAKGSVRFRFSQIGENLLHQFQAECLKDGPR